MYWRLHLSASPRVFTERKNGFAGAECYRLLCLPPLFTHFPDCHTPVEILQILLILSRTAALNAFLDMQAEVPSSVRAFWETGASHPGPLSTSVSLDSNRAAGELIQPLKHRASRAAIC